MSAKLGYGFMRLPLTDENDRSSIDYSALYSLVDRFMESGFTYFDTAYNYHNGDSERALKKTLVDRYPRDAFILTDKMPLFMVNTKDDMETIFNEQMERCGVQKFDNYLLHAVSSMYYDLISRVDAFGFLARKKEEGKVGHIGISYHDSAELLDRILTEHPEIELVQLQINYLDWDDPVIESRNCADTARKHGKKIIVMEPVKGGTLARVPEEVEKIMRKKSPDASPASWALRFVASVDGVDTILSGMGAMDQLDDNIKTFKEQRPLDDEDLKVISEARRILKDAIAVPCTSCRYCTKNCPMHINIPGYFSIYNNMKMFGGSASFIGSMYFGNLMMEEGSASSCVGCGRCDRICPQHIKVKDTLSKVNKEILEQARLYNRAFRLMKAKKEYEEKMRCSGGEYVSDTKE